MTSDTYVKECIRKMKRLVNKRFRVSYVLPMEWIFKHMLEKEGKNGKK